MFAYKLHLIKFTRSHLDCLNITLSRILKYQHNCAKSGIYDGMHLNSCKIMMYTVEPLCGHSVDKHVVLCLEVVPSLEVEI